MQDKGKKKKKETDVTHSMDVIFFIKFNTNSPQLLRKTSSIQEMKIKSQATHPRGKKTQIYYTIRSTNI